MIKFHIPIEIDRPLHEVFSFVTDPDALSAWQTNTVQATIETDGPFGVGTRLHEVHRAPGGRELHSTVEVSQYEVDRRFELRIVEGPLAVDGLFVFAPGPDGSTHLELFGSGKAAGAMRLAQPVLKRFVRRQFATNLKTLKRVMESGTDE
jgi:uncharacterized protein YndB with AHSA1/START domain